VVSFRIRRHLQNVFEGVADSKALADFIDEVSANLQEKMDDYMSGGISEEEAFQQVIGTLGDIRNVYLSRRTRPTVWLKKAIWVIMAMAIVLLVNSIWHVTRLPNDYMKFAQHGGGGEAGLVTGQYMITTDLVRVEYSVRYKTGRLGYSLYDSQGELIWQRDFSRNEKGEELVPVKNQGQAVLVVRGVARFGGIRFRVHEITED